jgi:hypothetical protein
MTTGRINQVTIPSLGPTKWLKNQSDGKPHAPNVQNLPSGRFVTRQREFFLKTHYLRKKPI